jgi:hypothetical protein
MYIPLPKRNHSTPLPEDATEGATKYRFLHLCTKIEVFGFVSKINKTEDMVPVYQRKYDGCF